MVQIGDAIPRLPYFHQVYKDGTQYVSISGRTGKVDYIGTSLSDLLNQIKAVDTNKGRVIAIEEGDYTYDSTVTYTSSHNTTKIIGLGNKFRTTIQPASDIPFIELQGTAYVELQDLLFANNLATFTAPFIRMKDVSVWNKLEDLYLINNVGNFQGIGVEIKSESTGQIYFNHFNKVWTRNLAQGYNIDSTTASDASPWINSNFWTDCIGYNCLNYVKLRQKSGTFPVGGSFAWNVFNNCHYQSKGDATPYSETVYDFDGNGFIQVAICAGSVQWDLNSSYDAIKVPTTGWLWLDATKDLVHRIGGTGITNPANMKISIGSDALNKNQGTSTFTGDGMQTEFIITHNNDWYYTNKIPNFVRVWAKSNDALDAGYVAIIPSSVTATQMTAKFQRPPRAPNPPGGTNNVIIGWEVYKL
jgi:hypothetical protein